MEMELDQELELLNAAVASLVNPVQTMADPSQVQQMSYSTEPADRVEIGRQGASILDISKTNGGVEKIVQDVASEEGAASAASVVNTKIKRKKRRHCLNGSCETISTDMIPAKGGCLTYYGYTRDTTKKWICDTCKERVDVYRKDIVKALEEGRPTMAIPSLFRLPQNVILDDPDLDEDDSSTEDEKDEEDDVVFILPEGQDLEELIDDIIKKMDINTQKEKCKAFLKREIEECEEFISGIVEQTREVENALEASREILNKNRTPEYNMTYLQSIDIDSRGSVRKVHDTDTATSSWIRHEAGTQVNIPGLAPGKRDIDEDDSHEVVPLKSVKREAKLTLSRTPEVIPRVMPRIGDKIYGMKFSSLNSWLPGIIVDTRTTIFNVLEFKVQFETTKKGKPITDPNMNPKDKMLITKSMSPKHIAYNLPCPFVLPTGTRVIARFKEDNRPGPGNYFAGVIAEPPRNINHYRYLIFFDDGYAQYVGQNEVLLVCESSKDVWSDVHPDSQEFIRNYLLSYPEKPMLRLQTGSIVSLEWNGRWFSTRVVEVDDSLAKMQFDTDKRVEWIYRGSARLLPIYNKRARSLHSASVMPRRNEGSVAIEYPDADVISDLNKSAPVAKKSTGQPPPRRTGNTQNLLNFKPATTTIFNTSSLVEYEGKMLRLKIPKDKSGPKALVPHDCGPSCVLPFDPTSDELRKVNPLLQPMWCGWSREIGKNPKPSIYYRAPCGRRLRDYDEMQNFLDKTKYNMGIEYFCYDIIVDVCLEFVPERQMYSIKDLSYSKEMVPIQCINSIDHDYPDFVQYTSSRLPGKEVKINLDDNFLSCCDCTDNCLDKDKCSCWQLTIEGTNLAGGEYNLDVGYQQRRLHEHVVSGVYECNQRCKCRSTCCNRVVQNPMKWQLQVFKTSTKGWAIRPLYDIPTGSFICVYAGQLLNEQSANEDGKTFGDEYLAELDYIEVIESYKEGFEAEVVEPQQGKRRHGDTDPDYVADFRGDDNSRESSGKVGRPAKSTKNVKSHGDSSDEEESTRRPTRFNPTVMAEQKLKMKRKPTRDLFGEEEYCYIMDAKTIGNIGRYLNHSCEPNVFVQNVFVDTHDIRFPWVCFFAYKHIRAGTELTWDYNYDIGSVPSKTMYCYCGTPQCRGRLL